jgi:hypothetical protein
MEFVLLGFGLCAGLASYGTQPVVNIGYVSNERCIVHLTVGQAGAFVWADHDIVIEFLEDGAVVRVDNIEHVLQRGTRV